MSVARLLVFGHLFSFLLIFESIYAQDFIVLPNGHSHNDYTRNRPLYDALQYGFTSIEIDVYLHDERMVVTHDDKNLDKKPSLQELYLDPLRAIIEENEGKVFKNDTTTLILMIDLKSEKVATYLALRRIFERYSDLIVTYKDGIRNPGPISILLSGGPPVDLIAKQEVRYFTVDGAVEQWSMDYSASLMPRASTNYRRFFKWYGKGDMPENEVEKLRELIQKAHAANRKIRFWASPNKVEVWQKLVDEGVDWINVDDLAGFNQFYRAYNKKE